MLEGNTKEDAFLLAENDLNNELRDYVLYSPVVAIAPGYVEKVDYDARSGFYVKIAHESGEESEPQITSFYAHLKRWPLVEVGEVVGAGTILGYEGTTGRSTGNHLHFEVKTKEGKGNPKDFIVPVFSPFYYDKKAEAILEKDEEKALGTEYYNLERTILLDDGLFNMTYPNTIKGFTLEDGTKIDYDKRIAKNGPYHSGDPYQGSAYSNIKWGNNVPTKELAQKLEDIIDLNLLNQVLAFEFTSGDNPNGGNMVYGGKFDVTSNPKCFEEKDKFFVDKLKWDAWFAIEMAEYKSPRVVPYYNGPRKPTDKIESAEALRDLKYIQDSLHEAGYYQMAGLRWEDVPYGVYSGDFVKVVKTMQQDLIDKGYDIYKVPNPPDGNLDINTLSAYNTMMQYSFERHQYIMSEKITYNSALDLSIEPALLWAFARVEGEYNQKYLALKEKEAKVGIVEEEYLLYPKKFNKEEGLLQINPKLAIERYKEDKVKSGDALLYIKQPMRNTNIGMEIIKEDMKWIYEKYSGDIEKAKNSVIYGINIDEYQWWYDELYIPGQKDETRWCDPENMDRVMLYALGAKMYDNRSKRENGYELTSSEVKKILTDPVSDSYVSKILTEYRKFIEDKK